MTTYQPSNENPEKMFKNIAIVILFFLTIALAYKVYTERIRTNGVSSGLMMNDSIEIYRNKYNQEVAKVRVINEDVLKLVYSRDSSLLALKKLVKDNKLTKPGNTAIRVENETKLPDIATKIDTFYIDSTSNNVFLYTDIDQFGEWIRGSIIASTDSIYLSNFTIRNSFSIILKSEKQGFLKPRKTVALITNENPYTYTKDLKVYQVKTPPAKRGTWFLYGIVAGVVGTSIILIAK